MKTITHTNPDGTTVRVTLGDGVKLGNGVTLGDYVTLVAPNIICAGRDRRGYEFLAGFDAERKEGRIFAGCRDFSLEDARAHWASNPEAMRKVEYLAAEIAARDVET